MLSTFHFLLLTFYILPLTSYVFSRFSKEFMKVFCIVGPSRSGKTTLIEQLIPELKRHGLKVAVVKHTHHQAALDTPGKDTWRHMQAGADTVALAVPGGYSILTARKGPYGLCSLLNDFPKDIDLVLVEGFKKEAFPKMEVVPAGQKPVFLEDAKLIGLISGEQLDCGKPVFSPDDIPSIVAFMQCYAE